MVNNESVKINKIFVPMELKNASIMHLVSFSEKRRLYKQKWFQRSKSYLCSYSAEIALRCKVS